MRHVGTDLPRPDAADKTRGRARYVADLEVPGTWIGATVRSPVACGRLRAITRSPDFDWSRVAVVTAKDVPGRNAVVLLTDDQPLLAGAAIAHHGEPLALVAAPERLVAAAGGGRQHPSGEGGAPMRSR
jgi:CO/xanthine dehydrogenase Mo-binding subunit